MTSQEIKRVKAWLYSIPATERAVLNLELAISDLKARIDNPPSYIVSGVANYGGIMGSGEFGGSKEQSYAEWEEDCRDRLCFLEDELKKRQRKTDQYQQTLEMLKQEPKWGYLAGEIIRKKYYCKVKPDKAIYTLFLFCGERTFYQNHSRGLQFFFDVLPDVFLK